MNVQLLSHTANPETLIAGAANLCYSNKDINGLMEGMTPEKSAKLVDKLINMGHESPLEHISFTFAIEGVSRVLSHQLVRHRVGASYSQRSQRYINEDNAGYTVPDSAKADKLTLSLYTDSVQQAFENYKTMTLALTFNKILCWTKDHWKEFHTAQTWMDCDDAAEWFEREHPEMFKKFHRTAQEDARYLLPNACHTSLIVTMNARALLNFFHQRCCKRAQREIRDLAWTMHGLVSEVAPAVFKRAGAGCMFGPCPEKEYTCGDPYHRKDV